MDFGEFQGKAQVNASIANETPRRKRRGIGPVEIEAGKKTPSFATQLIF